VSRRTGARQISEARGSVKVSQRHSLKAEPSLTPQAGGVNGDPDHAGNLGVIQSIGSRKHNPAAQNELLGRRVARDQALKRLPLRLRQFDKGRLGTTHDKTYFQW
jgi:hypothetical protein